MTFEGYREYITENGEYFTRHVYDDLSLDDVKKLKVKYMHMVDCTNGIVYNEDGSPCAETAPAPKEVCGFYDDWREDHYGNKYAIKVQKFKPLGNIWKLTGVVT